MEKRSKLGISKEGKGASIYEMDVGERGEWERMEKHRKDRKIGNSDFIDSVGDNLSPTHMLEKCK